MDIFDILFLAVALAMDAAAVGMTDGMADAKMPVKRVLTIGAFFGVFQALMPLGGYFLTKLFADAFLDEFETASSWVSFILLTLLGGKMIFDCVREIRAKNRGEIAAAENLARQMLLSISSLREVELEIKKPWAPIGLPVDFVSVKINRKWHTAYIAVGSNMGDRKGYLDMAADEIDADENCVLLKIADAIETKPYGMENQDDFLNSCMEVRTLYQPKELLRVCKQIEKRANRVKTVHWGPRTLDLDIIFYDDEVVTENDLAIPHVEMHKREFVLRPLAQIAPNKIHPLLQKRVVDILEELNH